MTSFYDPDYLEKLLQAYVEDGEILDPETTKILEKTQGNGMKCKKCQEYYPYGVSNQDDGSLICYGCKITF